METATTDNWRGINNWALPKVLPSIADLRLGIHILENPVTTPKHAAGCLAKLMVAFEPNTKMSPEETKLRLAVWIEANGDLGDELWAEATRLAMRESKWMPKPSEFRALVGDQLTLRSSRLHRAKMMLQEAGREKDAPFAPEPEDVRIRALRDSWKRVGRMHKAAPYEIELAKREGREAENWAKEVPMDEPPEVAKEAAPALKEKPEMRARLNIALARTWRANGMETRAESLEAEARALAPQLFEPLATV